MKNKINKIVIVGGGTAGWMTAASLSNSLGTEIYDITLVESQEIGSVGVGEATIPLISFFNDSLGLNEDEFIRETKATFKLGIEFINWKEVGHKYFHPFGKYGVDMDGVSFMHHWMRWHQVGGKLEIAAFNAESAAAGVGRFMRVDHASMGQKLMPNINYAYQFDASLYAKFLRKYAENRGAKRVEGKIVDVIQNKESGFIDAIKLENGQLIEGDIFVDCSGFRGLIIEQIYQTAYEDWSRWLPMNSAVAVPCEKADEIVPFTRSTAREEGWQWRIPLQHRTGNGYVYCDDYISDDEATSKLMNNLDGKALAEPRVIKFLTGMRKQCWVKNCVAIGLASGFLEPLESTSIHLIQRAVFKLLAMFPKDHINDLLVERFNREMEMEYTEVKDFLIAHYKVTNREDTPFWQYVKNMEIPESLQASLELFESRGEVMATNESLFKDVSWFAVLKGQGIEPKSYHPVADTISEDDLRLRLTKIRSGVQKRIDMMKKHEDYLRESGLMSMQ